MCVINLITRRRESPHCGHPNKYTKCVYLFCALAGKIMASFSLFFLTFAGCVFKICKWQLLLFLCISNHQSIKPKK